MRRNWTKPFSWCGRQNKEHAAYRGLNDELLKLRHVALSGDGEPTLCPNFAEAVQWWCMCGRAVRIRSSSWP